MIHDEAVELRRSRNVAHPLRDRSKRQRQQTGPPTPAHDHHMESAPPARNTLPERRQLQLTVADPDEDKRRPIPPHYSLDLELDVEPRNPEENAHRRCC